MQRAERHHHAFTLCQQTFHARPLERHSLLLFVLVEKIRKHGSSLTDCAQSLTAHDAGKNLDQAGAVMSDSTPLRCGVGERCCARSPGEPSPHHIGTCQQRGGRRRRYCTCRRSAGNGFDVWSAFVQGMCFLSSQMSLLMVM